MSGAKHGVAAHCRSSTISLASSCATAGTDNPLRIERQNWNTVQLLCKGTPHQSWGTCSRRLTANAEEWSIFTDYLLPDFAHVMLGNHCRSDPVQVWSREGNCGQELTVLLVKHRGGEGGSFSSISGRRGTLCEMGAGPNTVCIIIIS